MKVSIVCLMACASISKAAFFSVVDFGAVGDNATDDTAAFEGAIAAISASGTFGSLVVPSGGAYLIRPINLTSNMEFFIEDGATVLGVADASQWPIIQPAPSYGQGRDHPGPRYTSLLHAEHIENVTLRGEGPGSVLDGQGAYWWKIHNSGDEIYTRGHLVEFMYSSRVKVAHVTLKDSPFWTTHFFDCDGVHVHHVHVKNPDGTPNTDGFDPDSSRNVLIEHSIYEGGDDCVAIKSGWDCFGVEYNKPTQNVHIRNLTCNGGGAGIAIGSEMSGGVENIMVEDVRYIKANGVGHIKWGANRGGFVRNVTFRNIEATGTLTKGIFMDGYYGDPNPSCPLDWIPPNLPAVSDVVYENIDATEATVKSVVDTYHLMGLPKSPITNLKLSNVQFAGESGVASDYWTCADVAGTADGSDVAPWPPCEEISIV